MHNGIVNRRDKLQADNVNKPKLDTAFVTDNVSEHIVEIIDDHKEEIIPIISDTSYSSEEVNTLRKWLDGRYVFKKSFSLASLSALKTTLVENADLFYYDGTYVSGSVRTSFSDTENNNMHTNTSGNIELEAKYYSQLSDIWLTIYYLKRS